MNELITIVAPVCHMSVTFKTAAGGLAFMEFLTNKMTAAEFAATMGQLYGSQFIDAAKSLALTCHHYMSM